MKALLLCGSGPLGLKVLYCLNGMKATVETAGPSSARMLKYSRYARAHSEVRFWHNGVPSEEARQLLKEKVENEHFDVVIPSDMASAAFLAEMKTQFPTWPLFPCSDQTTLETLHNKWSFAQTCMKYELPIPTTVLLTSTDQVNETELDSVGFPLIVKPLEAESSHGVVRMESLKELQTYLANGSRYAAPPLILQSFIPGRDIDISILAAEDRILCSTVQSWIGEGVLEFTRHPQMHAIASRLVEAFHYGGLAHFDMRIDARDGRLFVIECNPRAWYTMSASMWQGLNFVDKGVRYVLEGTFPTVSTAEGTGRYCLAGSLWKEVLSPHSGWNNVSLSSIRGFAQAVTDPLPHLYSKMFLR